MQETNLVKSTKQTPQGRREEGETVQYGDFILCLRSKEILINGLRTKMPDKNFDILLALVRSKMVGEAFCSPLDLFERATGKKKEDVASDESISIRVKSQVTKIRDTLGDLGSRVVVITRKDRAVGQVTYVLR